MTRSGSRKSTNAERRARIEAARQAAVRAERRARLIRAGAYGGAALTAAGVITATALYVNHRDSAKRPLPHPAAATGATLPPWPAPTDPSAGTRLAGLRVDNTEGTVAHFHAHLDVVINGKAAAVPANLGINASSGELAELHTHDATGVLHIEAPDAKRRYVLGQLFTEWGVRLDSTHVGGLTATGGNTLRAYIDGKQVTGDPARVELTAHREVALVFGPATRKVQVPGSYRFPSGE